MRLILWFLSVAAPMAASAADLPRLGDVGASISGTEVVATGFFQFNPTGGRAWFQTDDGGMYNSSLAVSRDELKRLDQCSSSRQGMFDSPSELCKAEINAEIKVDGGNIELIIYSINFAIDPV